MYYSDEIIEEVRSRNNIVDVISSYVSLKRQGANYVGLCPFHNDHNPSFSVSERKQMYKCFSCGEGGNVFRFMMQYENMTFPEAVRALAERGGVELPQEQESGAERARAQQRERILNINKDAANYFYQQLHRPHGAKALEYLKGRQLSDETIRKFGLGFAGVDGRQVIDFLRSKGYEDADIRVSGLASFSEKEGLTSHFWNRVMFPIQDAGGHVIAFGGRVMGDAKPKYLNSPETDFFNKRKNMYGYHIARRSRAGNFILCEGYMDVIAMHQAGFDQAVASLGTAFTEEQANLLRRHKDRNTIYLAYDTDGPGVTAALRAIGLCREAGLVCKVIDMRPQKDPDEFIKANGREAFQDRIDHAENSFLFQARVEYEKVDQQDPDSRTAFQTRVSELLAAVPDELARNNYLLAVCERYGMNAEAIGRKVLELIGHPEEVSGYVRPKPTQAKRKREDASSVAQKMLLTYLTDDPGLYPVISKYVKVEDYTEGLYARVAELVYRGIEAGTLQPASLLNQFTEEEQSDVADILQAQLPETETEQDRRKALRDLILKVRENSYLVFSQDTGDKSMEHVMETIRRKKELEDLRRRDLF